MEFDGIDVDLSVSEAVYLVCEAGSGVRGDVLRRFVVNFY